MNGCRFPVIETIKIELSFDIDIFLPLLDGRHNKFDYPVINIQSKSIVGTLVVHLPNSRAVYQWEWDEQKKPCNKSG